MFLFLSIPVFSPPVILHKAASSALGVPTTTAEGLFLSRARLDYIKIYIIFSLLIKIQILNINLQKVRASVTIETLFISDEDFAKCAAT
jgi:hypothetical protein